MQPQQHAKEKHTLIGVNKNAEGILLSSFHSNILMAFPECTALFPWRENELLSMLRYFTPFLQQMAQILTCLERDV